MRHLLVALVFALAATGVARAQTSDAQVMAPITKFIDSFNKGDVAGAMATHASDDDLVIVDEVPPFQWRGAGAFKQWAGDLEADAKKNNITGPSVTLGKTSRSEVAGDRAYVIVPATYAFTQNGVAMHERAQMTFTLKKSGDGWLIAGWTWTGPKPTKTAAR